ncbi:hypothetical protein Tco_0905721 [Tanacetum coccineum]
MVTLVDGVLANSVVMIFEMDIAFYDIQGTKILSLMIRLRIHSIILTIFHTHLHNPNTYHTLSSVEDLVHTLSESDGISKSECDLTICNDSSLKKDEVLDDIISIPPRNGNDHFNAESSLIESVLKCDNMISSPKIDFLLEEFAGELALIVPIPPGIVEADFNPKGDIRFIENLMYDNSFPRPPGKLLKTILKLSSIPTILEVVEIVIPEVGGIDTDILLTIKDDILHEKLLNVNLLIAKIEALKDNPTPSSDFVTNEPDSGNFTMDVVEDIYDNPTRELYVHVLHNLPTHPTLHLDSDFTLSSDSPGSDLVVSFPSGIRNKIFDPGIFIEDKVVNSAILAADKEKSPHPSSHRVLRALNESPMMISGEDTPNLDVLYLHFYPP